MKLDNQNDGLHYRDQIEPPSTKCLKIIIEFFQLFQFVSENTPEILEWTPSYKLGGSSNV